jgi:hypothetical protein
MDEAQKNHHETNSCLQHQSFVSIEFFQVLVTDSGVGVVKVHPEQSIQGVVGRQNSVRQQIQAVNAAAGVPLYDINPNS